MGFFTSSALCLLGIIFSNPFLGAEAASCARDWMQNQGNCYAYFDDPMTWQEAEIECQSYGRGAHLASVLTEAETVLVAEHISTYQKQPLNVWIGLRDVRQNRRWRWADESVYNYKAWMKGEPNNDDNNEFCVELTGSTRLRQWNDTKCSKRNAYICKYEL
ncbi:C-type lectin-like [Pogona vitticeps]